MAAARARARAGLAGAGNIIAWGGAGRGGGGGVGDGGGSDAAAASLDADGHVVIHAPGDEEEGAAAAPGGGGAGAAAGHAVADSADYLAEMRRLAAESRADIEHDHAVFTRILFHRLSEARSLLAGWTARVVVAAEEAAADASVAAIAASEAPIAPFLALLRHLQTSAHDTVAVDVLHALHACSGTYDFVVEPASAGEDGEPVPPQRSRMDVRGGFPCWSPSATACSSVAWLEHAVPVLETLLYSNYEDHVTVALRSTQFLADAVTPLAAAAVAARAELSEAAERGTSADAGDAGTGEAGRAVTPRGRSVGATAIVELANEAYDQLAPLEEALQHATHVRVGSDGGAGGGGRAAAAEAKAGGGTTHRIAKLAMARLQQVAEMRHELRRGADA